MRSRVVFLLYVEVIGYKHVFSQQVIVGYNLHWRIIADRITSLKIIEHVIR